ncbi:hypothetical protein EB118_00320 [bacterium]|nr:hypothetical protein [bacterium]
MSEKLSLKEKLAAVDMDFKPLWDELSDNERKDLKNSFYLLNRYVSNVKGQNKEIQRHFILYTNEYFNKYWNDLQKHPKLLWMLLCMCHHPSKKIFFHEWLGMKKKDQAMNKSTKFLSEIYPDRKDDEIDLMAKLYTKKELKELAKDHGYSDKEIADLI